MVVEAQE
jgi:hypothetical protein